jgi:hypothetical protein
MVVLFNLFLGSIYKLLKTLAIACDRRIKERKMGYNPDYVLERPC